MSRQRPIGVTRREHFYGQLAATLMVRAGRLAEKRGDIHELRHFAAALSAGNTGPTSHKDGCLAVIVLEAHKPTGTANA